MKMIISIFVLLTSAQAMSEDSLQPIQPGQCVATQQPSYFPGIPRPVVDTVKTGADARTVYSQLSKSKNKTERFSADLFLENRRFVSVLLSSDTKTDASYPQDGCTYSANLYSTCEELVSGREYKCAEICQYSYNCIDNR